MLLCEAGENYPSKMDMEKLAESLDLTFKQVRTWFIEKRRKDKSDRGLDLSSPPNRKLPHASARKGLGVNPVSKVVKRNGLGVSRMAKASSTSLRYRQMSQTIESGICRRRKICQDLLPPDYILRKVFRKDGPQLGSEFDSPRGFCSCNGM